MTRTHLLSVLLVDIDKYNYITLQKSENVCLLVYLCLPNTLLINISMISPHLEIDV